MAGVAAAAAWLPRWTISPPTDENNPSHQIVWAAVLMYFIRTSTGQVQHGAPTAYKSSVSTRPRWPGVLRLPTLLVFQIIGGCSAIARAVAPSSLRHHLGGRDRPDGWRRDSSLAPARLYWVFVRRDSRRTTAMSAWFPLKKRG